MHIWIFFFSSSFVPEIFWLEFTEQTLNQSHSTLEAIPRLLHKVHHWVFSDSISVCSDRFCCLLAVKKHYSDTWLLIFCYCCERQVIASPECWEKKLKKHIFEHFFAFLIDLWRLYIWLSPLLLLSFSFIQSLCSFLDSNHPHRFFYGPHHLQPFEKLLVLLY